MSSLVGREPGLLLRSVSTVLCVMAGRGGTTCGRERWGARFLYRT